METREEASQAYQLSLTDVGFRIRCTSDGAVVVTVPASSEVAWVEGTKIHVLRGNSASLDIVGADGVTIHDRSVREGRWRAAWLVYEGSDVWGRTGAGFMA